MANSSTVFNRKAGFDIEVQEKYEVGIVLTGSEIKSIRAGRAQLSGSYMKLMRGRGGKLPEAVIIGLHLSLADDPERTKRLLLHAREIQKISMDLEAKGKVAVPLALYLKHGWAKLTIGVGAGRKQYDKRKLLKSRDEKRDERRELKGFRRS